MYGLRIMQCQAQLLFRAVRRSQYAFETNGSNAICRAMYDVVIDNMARALPSSVELDGSPYERDEA